MAAAAEHVLPSAQVRVVQSEGSFVVPLTTIEVSGGGMMYVTDGDEAAVRRWIERFR